MSKQLFFNTIVNAFYKNLHTTVTDNYDSLRFSYDGVDRSKEFSTGVHAAYFQFFADNYEAFYTTYLFLKDDDSRDLFVCLILYRLLGHLHFRIRDKWTASQCMNQLKLAESMAVGASNLDIKGMFGPLTHFENVPASQGKLKVDCWGGNIMFSFILKQYFLERPQIVIRPEPGDVAIDAGACFGDTSLAFASATGNAVYAFDLLPTHIKTCKYNFEQNGMQDQIHIYPYGISDQTRNIDKPITVDQGGMPGFSILGMENQVPTISIDDFVEREKLQKLDFIKMDIEGSELAALYGAKKTITRFRPKLAISLYHRIEDFITIPQFLMLQFPFYDFYLDHYTIHSEETVLYATPR